MAQTGGFIPFPLICSQKIDVASCFSDSPETCVGFPRLVTFVSGVAGLDSVQVPFSVFKIPKITPQTPDSGIVVNHIPSYYTSPISLVLGNLSFEGGIYHIHFSDRKTSYNLTPLNPTTWFPYQLSECTGAKASYAQLDISQWAPSAFEGISAYPDSTTILILFTDDEGDISFFTATTNPPILLSAFERLPEAVEGYCIPECIGCLPKTPPCSDGYQLIVTGGTAPWNFWVVSGHLPEGTTVTSSGKFSGVPKIGQCTDPLKPYCIYKFNVLVHDWSSPISASACGTVTAVVWKFPEPKVKWTEKTVLCSYPFQVSSETNVGISNDGTPAGVTMSLPSETTAIITQGCDSIGGEYLLQCEAHLEWMKIVFQGKVSPKSFPCSCTITKTFNVFESPLTFVEIRTKRVGEGVYSTEITGKWFSTPFPVTSGELSMNFSLFITSPQLKINSSKALCLKLNENEYECDIGQTPIEITKTVILIAENFVPEPYRSKCQGIFEFPMWLTISYPIGDPISFFFSPDLPVFSKKLFMTQSFPFTVSFFPISQREYVSRIDIQISDGTSRTAKLFLKGQGVSPTYQLDDVVNCGTWIVGSPPKTCPFTIQNSSSYLLWIKSVTTDDPQNFLISQRSVTVPANSSFTFNVTFWTTTPGSYATTFSLFMNTDPPSDTVLIRIDAFELDQVANFSPNFIDFGKIYLGSISSQTSTLANFSSLSSIFVQVLTKPQGFDVSPSSALLSPSSTFNFDFFAFPTTEDTFEGTFIFKVDILAQDGSVDWSFPLTVRVKAEGVIPRVRISPELLDFGKVLTGTEKKLYVQIANLGSAPLEITGITVQNPFSSEEILPVVVAPDTVETFWLSFAPQQKGTYEDTVVFWTNAGTDFVKLKGEGVELAQLPDIVIVPDPVAFGDVPLGQKARQTISVINNSSDTVSIFSVQVSGPFFAQQITETQIPPAGTFSFDITFLTFEEGEFSGRITVETSKGKFEVYVLARGVPSPNPTIKISPALLDFGKVKVGRSKKLEIEVENLGLRPLEISSILVQTPFSANYEKLPLSLEYKKKVKLEVYFRPEGEGRYEGKLVITSNDPENPKAEVELTGQGALPHISAKDKVDFGFVKVGKKASLNFPVANTGAWPLTITSITLEGDKEFSIEITGNFPKTVSPNSSLIVKIVFLPERQGSFGAKLVITSDDPENPIFEVQVSGSAGLPEIFIPISEIFLPEIYVDERASYTIPVSNRGVVPLEVTAYVQDSQGVFSLTPTRISVEPGKQEEIVLEFVPQGKSGNF